MSDGFFKYKNEFSSSQGRAKNKKKENFYIRTPDIPRVSHVGKLLSGGECPNCGATYSSTAQICPECGMGLGGNKCTFCGNTLSEGDMFCKSCGGSREGVECPDCGTINYRNFCRNCNRPLTKRGETAMLKFQSHPNYKEASKINDNLDKLADYIDGKIHSSDPAIVALTAQVKENFSLDSKADEELPKLSERPQINKNSNISKKKPLLRFDSVSNAERPMTIEEAMKLYEQKKKEMDDLLDSIMPDSESTPEEQRDFYSARLTVVTRQYKKMVKKPVAWICNFCGYRHNKPQECAEPWHGGTWVHEVKEESYEVSTLEKMD